MRHRIGEILEITKETEITSQFDGKTIKIKIGDRGFLDSRGMIHYFNGEAKGKIQKLDNAEMRGYDYESISKLVFKRLNSDFVIKDILAEKDIDETLFKESIEDVLSDIF